MFNPDLSFWKKAKRIILCILVVFMMQEAIAPKPAQADVTAYLGTIIINIGQALAELYENGKKAAQWAMEELQLNEIVSILVDLYEIFSEQFAKLVGYFFVSGAAEIMSNRVVTQVKVNLQKEIVKARTEHTIAAANARQVERLAPPKDPALCKAIMVHQIVTTTDDFEREVSRMIVEGISSMARALGEDGAGPRQVMKETQERCGGTLKLGSVYDGHNGCYNQDTLNVRGTDGRMLQDADLSTIDGSQIYEIPLIKKETRTVGSRTMEYIIPQVNMTAESANDQKFWMAAFNALYQKLGARPTPIAGEALKTPTGVAQRQMYNHCLANQNALIKQCADLLAFYTRPNHEDTGTDKLRKTQKRMCDAAKGVISLDRFDNCDRGLSPYEVLLLQQSYCLSSNHYLGLAAAGSNTPKSLKSSELCNDSWTNFTALVARKHYNCTAAMDAINEMDDCWKAVENLGRGGSFGVRKTSANDNVPSTGAVHRVKASGSIDGYALAAQPSAMSIPSGQPALPAAVGQ